MTPRQRLAGTAVVAAPALVESRGPTTPTRWEEWYSSASPRQRQEILDLAGQQGVLYVHQIPPPRPAERSEVLAVEAGGLSSILAGDLSALPPPPRVVAPSECAALDLAQREAVARALNTPDIFLLAGLPGAGKSLVAAEIVRAACRLGWRVLLLAPHAPTLDSLLEKLSADACVFPLRYPGPDEVVAQLAPAVQAMTPGRRGQALAEQMRQSAQQMRGTLAESESQWESQASAWRAVCALAPQHQDCAADLRRLHSEAEGLEAQVRADAQVPGETQFHRLFADLVRKQEEKTADITRRQIEIDSALAQAKAALADLQPHLDELRPLAEAKRGGRWWTRSWWQAWRRGNVVEQYDALEAQARGAQSSVDSANAFLAQIAAEGKQAERERNAQADVLIQGEIEHRRTSLQARQEAFARLFAELDQAWRDSLQGLNESDRPLSSDAAAVESAFAAWQSQFDRASEKARLTRSWANDLENPNGDFVKRLPQLANVLAATLDAPPPDLAAAPFDLLLIEDAQYVTEADLSRFGRFARRCVLVADAGMSEAADRAGDAAASHPNCFRKLWRILHQDAAAPPYVWLRENGRLCCRFRPIAAEEEARLEVEFLADFPEIELRISPSPTPSLVQIAFPADMNLSQAKQFIYRELQELPVRRLGTTAWISESNEGIVCHLSPHVGAHACSDVELEKGLHEWACESHTHRLAFDRRSGWTRDEAERWLQSNLGVRDLGRTLTLGVCHRAKPGLGALLSDLFFAGRMLPAPTPAAADDHAGFQFIPVPAPVLENGKKLARPVGSILSAWPREGAGLEIDLTAIRTADRIPSDLRAMLPRRGFVNYLEAQAVVKHLEAICHGETALSHRDVAVLALYQGQVDLIRILIERSELLKGLGKISVNLPDAFRQNEVSTVLLSLTRSHSHRAVAIGESPAQFPLACTRARDRVVLFADPGNLVKRAAWQGPLEHLDAASAAEETRHIIPLVRYLQGNGAHQQHFQVHDATKSPRHG